MLEEFDAHEDSFYTSMTLKSSLLERLVGRAKPAGEILGASSEEERFFFTRSLIRNANPLACISTF